LAIGNEKTDVYALRLAGWLAMKKEEKRKAQSMIHKRFFCGWCVCVCVCSSLKNACARKEKVKKNANVPCHFFVQTLPCKLPPHQRERIQQEKDGTDKQEICDKFQVRSNRCAKNGNFEKFRKKE